MKVTARVTAVISNGEERVVKCWYILIILSYFLTIIFKVCFSKTFDGNEVTILHFHTSLFFLGMQKKLNRLRIFFMLKHMVPRSGVRNKKIITVCGS